MRIYQLLCRQADRIPDRPFLLVPEHAAEGYASGPVEFSYAKAFTAVQHLRSALGSAGVGPTHRVALALDNRADFFLSFLAVNALDACAVPLNMDLATPELAHVLTHSQPALVVCLPHHHGKLAAAVEEQGLAIPIVEQTPGGMDVAPIEAGPGPTTDAAVVYTSGTTGTPKGCRLSEDYFLYAGTWYRDLGGLCTLVPDAERLLTPLPTFHVNALAFSFMAMLTTGGCVVQLDRFHPRTWWSSVRQARATALHYLGVMPAILMNMPKGSDEAFGGQVKFGFGAGVEPEHHAAFEARFGFPLVEGWAMTETGAGGCFMAVQEPRHVGARCIGRPPASIEYRIVDDHGSDVVAGVPGEFWVRASGPDPCRGFFSGYLHDEEATSELWAGGWLHSGDVVVKDTDGSLFFVERKKNIIRRSGENIAISEVENALLQHPAVKTCAVAPVKDALRGEEVFACIVPSDSTCEHRELAEALFEFCRLRLAYFKLPGYVAFVSAVPTSPTQKIERGRMKRLASELLDNRQCIDLRQRKRKNEATAKS